MLKQIEISEDLAVMRRQATHLRLMITGPYRDDSWSLDAEGYGPIVWIKGDRKIAEYVARLLVEAEGQV